MKTRGEVLVERVRAARPAEMARAAWGALGRPGRLFLAVVALLVPGIWIWSALSSAPEDAAWRRIRQSGVITFATDASYPPFATLDGDGAIVGFDVDVAREIGRRLGLRAGFENVAYDGLLGTLIVGRDDAAISALVAAPGRLDEIAYTRPYFNAGPVLVLRSDVAPPPQPMRWSEGKVLAVEYGSQAEALARRWGQRVTGVSILARPGPRSAMAAVESGEADAGLVDAVSAYAYLAESRSTLNMTAPVEDVVYVIAVARRSVELREALDSALKAMEADGTLETLRIEWFGE